jgi:1-acyl-sn-glycerol-3-phosphate acyltransferase
MVETPVHPNATETSSPEAISDNSGQQFPNCSRSSKLFRWLSYLLLWPLFALTTAAFGSVSLLASIFDGQGRIQHAIAHAWGGALLRITMSPVRVIGAENLKKAPVAVYAANHLSYMDTPVVLNKLPFQFRILARHDLFRLPFIGWYLRRSGQISVDSSSLRSTLASLNRGVKVLQGGMPVVIFPEGGRSADGNLQRFLSGPAYMAIRAQVPVVPVALIGTYELMPMHTYHLQPRPLLVVVGEPISTIGYTSKMADALTQRMHRAISEMFARRVPSSTVRFPLVEGGPEPHSDGSSLL